MNEETMQSFVETGVVNTDVSGFVLEKTAEKLRGKIYLLMYKHHEVQIGMIKDGQIEIERADELTSEFLKELRVFSENGELYIWKQNQELKYRLRTDDEGNDTFKIYEEEHFMWGNAKKDEYTIHEKNRGMEFKFPFHIDEKQLPLKYTVQNYYNYDENGLIQFKDARLVCFLHKDGEKV